MRFPLPVGFVYDDDKIVIDPDQEVQGAVRTVFDLFSKEGTAYGVVRRFQEAGLRFPRRSYGGVWNGKLIWGRLTHYGTKPDEDDIRRVSLCYAEGELPVGRPATRLLLQFSWCTPRP